MDAGRRVDIFMGFRDESGVILHDDFTSLGARVHIATDDGSRGFHGTVTDCMRAVKTDAGVANDCDQSLKRNVNLNAGVIYSCGPTPMLRAVAAYAEETGARCFVSVEERMACGLGACVGCAIKVKDGDATIYKKVCTDGPVFNARGVCWNE